MTTKALFYKIKRAIEERNMKVVIYILKEPFIDDLPWEMATYSAVWNGPVFGMGENYFNSLSDKQRARLFAWRIEGHLYIV